MWNKLISLKTYVIIKVGSVYFVTFQEGISKIYLNKYNEMWNVKLSTKMCLALKFALMGGG